MWHIVDNMRRGSSNIKPHIHCEYSHCYYHVVTHSCLIRYIDSPKKDGSWLVPQAWCRSSMEGTVHPSCTPEVLPAQTGTEEDASFYIASGIRTQNHVGPYHIS